MPKWLSERWQTLVAAAGYRRYLAAPAIVFLLGLVSDVAGVLPMNWLTQTSNWSVATIIAFGLIIIWLLNYGTELRLRLRPTIEFAFDPAKCVRRVEDSNIPVPDNLNNKAPSIWYLLQVINTEEHKVAENCRVSLTKVEFLEGGKFIDAGFGAAQILGWSMRDNSIRWKPADIYHAEPTYTEVISVDPVYNAIKIKWQPPEWKSNERLFERVGTYRLTISASLKEGKPTVVRVLVDWDGNWENVKMRLEA